MLNELEYSNSDETTSLDRHLHLIPLFVRWKCWGELALTEGADPYTLQIMLGHSTMDMVKRYLNIAQADLDKSHRMASPVDNWRL